MYRHQILVKIKEFDGIDDTVDKIFDHINGIAQKDLYCDIQINPVNLF
jgi:primosomal protein N'